MITFLSARVPLTKAIAFDGNGKYTVTPYPQVRDVSSHVEQVNSISELHQVLVQHAALNHCVLKGNLDKQLNDESRAGHTLEQPHQWIVFDFDKVDCEPSHDGVRAAIIKYLPKSLHDVSYVSQLSASCSMPGTRKLSAHVFMWLDKPMTSQQLFDWFTWLNWNSELKKEITLTDSGVALHWPLDRTVAHASKLIYIAAPRCIGFRPSITNHIKYERGRKQTVPAVAPQHVSQDELRAYINVLRQRAGLSEIAYSFVNNQNREVLKEAPAGVIHDVRPSGDGYIRFNMNGGDSLAYFINLREPHLIGNHKGEPYLYTEQVDANFYKSLVKASRSVPVRPTAVSVEPLAFYATNRQSTVFIGTYDRENDELVLHSSTETAAKSWLVQHGGFTSGPLPHYSIVTDMHSEIRYEEGYPVINTYKRSDYIKQFADADKAHDLHKTVALLSAKSPVIWMTLKSALGSENAAAHFINWLGFIFQRRTRTTTAWVMHGVQGTGKGNLVHHVLKPLLGESFVAQLQFNLAKTNFNASLEGKMLVAFDEANIGGEGGTELMDKLKNWITEPTVMINNKGKDEREVKNFANFIFQTNTSRPVIIDAHDRRFNVGEYQQQRLLYSANQWAILENGEELPAFAEVLGQLHVDEEMVRRTYDSESKSKMYEATHSIIDRVGIAIHSGDTQFFVDSRPSDVQLRGELLSKQLPISEYDTLLHLMAANRLTVLSKNDLYVLFRVVIINDKLFPNNNAEQRRIYARCNINTDKAVRDGRAGKVVRGFQMPKAWNAVDPEMLPPVKEAKVTPIGAKK